MVVGVRLGGTDAEGDDPPVISNVKDALQAPPRIFRQIHIPQP